MRISLRFRRARRGLLLSGAIPLSHTSIPLQRKKMHSIFDYMRDNSNSLGERILETFPPSAGGERPPIPSAGPPPALPTAGTSARHSGPEQLSPEGRCGQDRC